MTDFRIRVIVDPSQAKVAKEVVNKELTQVENKADSLRQTLKRTFAFVTVGLAVREVQQLTDSFTTIQNRLRTVNEDQAQVNETFGSLVGIANQTRTEIDAIAGLYQRGSIAAAELGASNEELLKFVERVGQGLAIQGGSAAAASGALTQLSQALGSGIVRAEEFNSILEGAFPIAQAAARGIDRAGGSVARLRQLIVRGEVTSRQFFEGFLEGSKQLEEQFGRTLPTLAQSFTVLRNSLVEFIGESDKSISASATLAQGVILLAQNLEALANSLLAVGAIAGTAFLVRLGRQAVQSVKGVVELNKAIKAGNFVLLGSAQAEQQQAAARVASLQASVQASAASLQEARATLAATQATLADIKAKVQHAVVVRGDTTAQFARIQVMRQAALIEQQVAAQTAAVAKAQTAFVAQTNLLTAAQSTLNARTAVATARVGALSKAWTFLNTTTVGITGTLVTAGAAFFAVNKILEFQKELLDDIAEAFNNVVEDSKFPALGTQIRILQQDLRRLDEIAKAQGGFLSDSQQARRDQVAEALARVREEARKLQEQSSRVDESRRKEKVTVDNLVQGLRDQAKALQTVGREGQVQARVQAEINKLLKAGQLFDEAETRRRLESEVRRVQALEDQKRVLEEIRGPNEDLRANLQATSALLLTGRINLAEYTIQVAKLMEEFNKAKDEDPFREQVTTITDANALLQVQIDKGRQAAEIRRTILGIEKELGRELTDPERSQVERESKRNDLLGEQARILAQIRGPQQRFNLAIQALNSLQDQGKITTEQYLQTLAKLREEFGKQAQANPFDEQIRDLEETVRLLEIRAEKGAVVAEAEEIRLSLIRQGAKEEQIDLERIIALLERRNELEGRRGEVDQSFGAGIQRGLQQVNREAENLAAVGQRVVSTFADQATDAILKFVQTGKFSFKEFGSAVLAELQRILVRLLVIQTLSAAFGGFAPAAAPLANLGTQALNRGAQGGATVQPGQRPRMVGEGGPERFMPDRTGTIVPNPADVPQEPPQVNVQVIVVSDEDAARKAVASGELDEVIMVRLGKNKDSAKQSLGLG